MQEKNAQNHPIQASASFISLKKTAIVLKSTKSRSSANKSVPETNIAEIAGCQIR